MSKQAATGRLVVGIEVLVMMAIASVPSAILLETFRNRSRPRQDP